MRYLFSAMGLVWVVACIGCGETADGLTKFPVTGTVLFDGSPVEEGQIIFRPSDGNGHSFAGPIKDGKFSFDSSEGSKQVEITAYKINEATQAEAGPIPGETVSSRKAYIPEKYNRKTTLSIMVGSIEKNYYEFDLAP